MGDRTQKNAKEWSSRVKRFKKLYFLFFSQFFCFVKSGNFQPLKNPITYYTLSAVVFLLHKNWFSVIYFLVFWLYFFVFSFSNILFVSWDFGGYLLQYFFHGKKYKNLVLSTLCGLVSFDRWIIAVENDENWSKFSFFIKIGINIAQTFDITTMILVMILKKQKERHLNG